MSEQQLFIPKKIKVGYQERNDTYSKRLAYVIYYDNKGVLRKEKSWTGWCSLVDVYQDDYITKNGKYEAILNDDGTRKQKLVRKGLGSDEYDNVPTSGFVLNKGVGGVKQSYGWNTRNEYIRVFDPRGFEFEISIKNLLFILDTSNSYKGKGLEGDFIYSWDGQDLVLLPCDSLDYQNSLDFTSLKDMKVSTKELIEGATYQLKNQNNVIYMGKFDTYHHYHYHYYTNQKHVGAYSIDNEYMIYNIKSKSFHTIKIKDIAKLIDDTKVANYADLYIEMCDKSTVQPFESIESNIITSYEGFNFGFKGLLGYHATWKDELNQTGNTFYVPLGNDKYTQYTIIGIHKNRNNKSVGFGYSSKSHYDWNSKETINSFYLKSMGTVTVDNNTVTIKGKPELKDDKIYTITELEQFIIKGDCYQLKVKPQGKTSHILV